MEGKLGTAKEGGTRSGDRGEAGGDAPADLQRDFSGESGVVLPHIQHFRSDCGLRRPGVTPIHANGLLLAAAAAAAAVAAAAADVGSCRLAKREQAGQEHTCDWRERERERDFIPG